MLKEMKELQWLTLFTPQLAKIADAHDLDCRTEHGYEEAVTIFLEISKNN